MTDNDETRYQCCFCARTIASKAPDVASLVYAPCIDHADQEDNEQELFCHTECLRSRLHKSAILYAADLCNPEFLASSGDEGPGLIE